MIVWIPLLRVTVLCLTEICCQWLFVAPGNLVYCDNVYMTAGGISIDSRATPARTIAEILPWSADAQMTTFEA